MPHSHTLTPQQIARKRAAGESLDPDHVEPDHRHVITVRLENSTGALNRVANMFSARGFNLESVCVGETEDPTISRMTLVTTGNDRVIRQVLRQLNNLVDTLVVEDVTGEPHVERELCLIKVPYTAATRAELMDYTSIFRARVINITAETLTLEATGPPAKVDALIDLLRPHGILDLARSGRVAMRRTLGFEAGDPVLLSPKR